ncbi:MAG: vitamin K epoxide reductase family protein [Candidatus Melainabacteria bacterium]|nr:MAG: vitamin K epoxide reductase family protein [Candidatus Melainabacteria bacterium]
MRNLENTEKSETGGARQNSPRYQILDCFEANRMHSAQATSAIATQNYKLLWTYAINCILAIWLIINPHLFDYRSTGLEFSDTISGAMILFFEAVAFVPRFNQVRWGTALVAIWLLFAPLIFWAPSPAVFLNDTLAAGLLIAMSILVPGNPGSGGMTVAGPDQPPGWTYNPSSWIRRWAGIALALIGFFISRYLAAHQLGYIHHAWDPFFGNGTDRVTSSSISRAFPISDAGFGSVAYMMEVLLGFMGDRARWRTAPWIVVMFAMLVLPLGVTSIVLIITQPIFVGAWCGLCLIAAAALMTSVPLSVHEAIAVGQFLVDAKRQKKNMWRIFWQGGTVVGAGNVDPDRRNYSFAQRCAASVQGVNIPINLLAQLAVGAWLMARPDLLRAEIFFPPGTPAGIGSANCDHLFGALVVTVAAISTAEVTRIVRFANILPGIAIIASGIIFSRYVPVIFLSELVPGILLIVTSMPRGAIAEKYGSWDRFVR